MGDRPSVQIGNIMAMEKGLYAAPMGLDQLLDQNETPDFEIEIEDPEAVTIHSGNLEIEIVPDGESDFYANIAEELDDAVLQSISGDLLGLQ